MKVYPDWALDLFWSHVDKDPEGCWLWVGPRSRWGYGTYRHRHEGHAIRMQAHRMSWEITHWTPVPDGMFICHRCDNPPCVRPDHLFLGTHLENMRDAAVKGRMNRGPRNNFYRLGHERPPNPSPPPYWKRLPRGQSHQNAKLTNEQAGELRRLYFEEGATQIPLARMFGISQSEVSYIVRGIHFITDQQADPGGL